MSKEKTAQNPDLALCNVTLTTWGTHADGGNGMSHFLDVQMFGGNVGHASVAVTFPADNNGIAMIEQYCYKEGNIVLPFERTSQMTQDQDGKLIAKDVFTVYFSWWPGADKTFSLKQAINVDNVAERLGVESPVPHPRFDLPPPERRVYRGQLGSKVFNLNVKNITHQRGLTNDEFDLLELDRKRQLAKDDVTSIELLLKKLTLQDKMPIVLSDSLIKLLDSYVKGWKTKIGNAKKITPEQADILYHDASKTREAYDQKWNALERDFNLGIKKRNDKKEALLQQEVSKIKTQLGTLQGKSLQEKIEGIKENFSPLAWITYDREKLIQTLVQLQDFRTFLREHYDFVKDKELILQALFDQNFPEGYKLSKWQECLPNALQDIKRDEMSTALFTQLKKLVAAEIKILEEKQHRLATKVDLYTVIDPLFEHNYENFVSKGLPPDDRVALAVGGITKNEHQRNGLNIEKMLGKMRDIIDSGIPFNLEVNNCSVTTGAVLAAGADPEFKDMLKQRAWGGGFGTPQEVLNGAASYQDAVLLNNGKLTFAQKINKYNPLNGIAWMGGQILKKLANPITSTIAKVGLGIVGVPVAVLALISETLKGIVNPKKSFNLCRGFISYAWENNSLFLKACSLPVAVFAGIMAIPATLQTAAQIIASPITRLFKAKSNSEKPQTPSVFNQQNYVEIDSKSPILALNQLSVAFKTQPGKIPVFSAQTQVLVDKYLSKLNWQNPDELKIMNTYQEMVLAINRRVNDLTPKSVENEKAQAAPIKPVLFKRTKPSLFQEKSKTPSPRVKLALHRVAIKKDHKPLNKAVHAIRLLYEEKIKGNQPVPVAKKPNPKLSGKT